MNTNNDNIILFPTIKQSDWQCEMFGTGKALVLHPKEGYVPNWFWRTMQFLLLGNRWYRISDAPKISQ